MALAQSNLVDRGYTTVYTVPTQRITSCDLAIFANANAKIKVGTSSTTVTNYTAPKPLSTLSAGVNATTTANGSSTYYRGTSIAVSGNGRVIITGASRTASVGQFYLSYREATSWNDAGSFGPTSYTSNGLYFGSSVAINNDGTYLAIGYGATQNAVEIYTHDGIGNVTHQQTITSLTGFANSDYYRPRVLSFNTAGTLLAIGCYGYNGTATAQGQVLIYSRSGTVWTLRDTIANPSPALNAYFGWSCAMSQDGTRLIVGEMNAAGGLGKVHMFYYSGGTWTSQATITGTSSGLGYDVDIDSTGTRAVASDNGNGITRIYKRTNTTWAEEAAVSSSGGSERCAINPDGTTVLSSYMSYNGTQGRVYVYRRLQSGTTWTQYGTEYTGGAGGDLFGSSVSVGNSYYQTGVPAIAAYSGSTSTPAYDAVTSNAIGIGAWGYNAGGNTGRTYIYENYKTDETTYNTNATTRNAAVEIDILTQLASIKNKFLESVTLAKNQTYQRTGVVMNANENLIVELEADTDVVVHVRGFEQVA